MKILMVGDIVGKPGRRGVKAILPQLRSELEIDLIIANGENCAHGKGITLSTSDDLFSGGVDVITSGNHIWAQKEILDYLDSELPILRPLNYPPGVVGKGYMVWGKVLVVNLMGRVFMENLDCPFRALDNLLATLEGGPKVRIIDFHAEATSEKNALGRYVDGRVSGVFGTHTHVPTCDVRILPHGTAYVTDVGMVGPAESIIGDDASSVIQRFLTSMPHRLTVGSGDVVFNSVLVEVDEVSGRAQSIVRIDREVELG